ncbi:MAG: DedA family protein [candidate division Zixibacteria bacterium]|nr:DedA family protein [candidate division Zixibacteria bacterium]
MAFEEILQYLVAKQAVTIYIILAISAYIENVFPPWPSDTMLLVGAFLAGRGELEYIPLYISVIIGGLAGAMTLYYLGNKKGRSFFEKYDKYYFKIENMQKIERWFEKWGNLLLIVSRFLAGIRSLVAITAGIGNVSVSRMTFFSLISFCLWYAILIGGMYLLKSNWQKLVGVIKSYNIIFILASALAATVWLVIIYKRSGIKK